MENLLSGVEKLYISRKRVHFSDDIEIFFIPIEERKGEWMTYAID